MKGYLRAVRGPLLLLTLFGVLQALSSLAVVPSMEELGLMVEGFFQEYGLLAVGVLSVIENIVGLNAYFPGSIVILTGMAMTAGDSLRGLITYLVIMLTAFFSYTVNFIVGRYFGRASSRNGNYQNEKDGLKSWLWFFGSFWHPHFAAITCFAAGSEGFSYRWFALRMLVIGVVWNSFWGFTMYHVGSLGQKEVNLTVIMYIYLIGWLSVDSWKYWRSRTGTSA